MPGKPIIVRSTNAAQPPVRTLKPAWRNINAYIVATACSDDPNALLVSIRDWMEDMNLVNLATSWHRLAKIVETRDALCDLLATSEEHSVVVDRLMTLTEFALRGRLRQSGGFADGELRETLQSVSNIAWAFGVLKWGGYSLMEVLVQWHWKHLQSFLPFEVGSACRSFARCASRDRSVEALTHEILVAASQYLGQEVLSKTGFRTLVMVTWACADRGCNLRLVTDIFLPRIKTMLRKADLTCDIILELVEAYQLVSTKILRRKFCWNDIISHTLRSVSAGGWSPADVAKVACALLRHNNHVPELAKLCQHHFATSELSKTDYLSVIQACCLPTTSPDLLTGLPHLQTVSADSLMTLLNPYDLPWKSLTFEELSYLTTVAAAQMNQRPTQGHPYNQRLVQKQAKEFLRTAAGYLLYDPNQPNNASGVALARMVASFAPITFAGDKPLHDILIEEVIWRSECSLLGANVWNSIHAVVSNVNNQAYQAAARAMNSACIDKDPYRLMVRQPSNASGTSRTCFRTGEYGSAQESPAFYSPGPAAPFQSATLDDEDLLHNIKEKERHTVVCTEEPNLEINWCSCKNTFLEFAHVSESTPAPAPAMELTLRFASWLEVSDMRMQFQYYGLV